MKQHKCAWWCAGPWLLTPAATPTQPWPSTQLTFESANRHSRRWSANHAALLTQAQLPSLIAAELPMVLVQVA